MLKISYLALYPRTRTPGHADGASAQRAHDAGISPPRFCARPGGNGGEWCREEGFSSLVIHASDAGRQLENVVGPFRPESVIENVAQIFVSP